jgi:hypothetical protein
MTTVNQPYSAPPAVKVRPTGVTILTVLYALESLLVIFGGVALIGLGGAIAGSLGAAIGAIIGIPMILIGLVMLFVTYGLWMGKGWARFIAIIFVILSLLVNLAGALGLSPSSIIGLLINLLILWYLFQPNVKAYYA